MEARKQFLYKKKKSFGAQVVMLIWFDFDIILCIYSKKIKNKH